MTVQARVLIFLGAWLIALLSGWFIRGWYEGNKELSRVNSAIVATWTLQSDLNGVMAKLQKARADQLAANNKVDEGYAAYLKDPNRNNGCTKFSDKRVQLKNAAVAAANGVQ